MVQTLCFGNRINNFIPHFTGHVITYPCMGIQLIHVSRGALLIHPHCCLGKSVTSIGYALQWAICDHVPCRWGYEYKLQLPWDSNVNIWFMWLFKLYHTGLFCFALLRLYRYCNIPLEKMATISLTTFSNAFSCINDRAFCVFEFDWS